MLVRKLIPWLSALLGGSLLIAANSAFAEYGLNMPPGVTEVSRDVYSLHMLIFWICVAIGVSVFSVMLYSIFNHRKSKGAKAAHFHESTTVEIIWTVVPILILIAMAVPATQTLIKMDDVSNSDLTIKITGFQWKWRYDYLDQNVGFFSVLATPRDQIDSGADKSEHYLREVDRPLVVPVGTKIRFLITSNDVIHAWGVPELAIKKDAIPGFINEVWTRIDTPGIYRGQCVELCGKDHGFMPIVVEAKSQEDYQSWLSEQQALALASTEDADKVWTHEELMTKGEQVYTTNCVACHQATGEGIPGVFPALKGSKIATGPAADHLNIVLHGKTGTAMAAFGAQLSDSELAAVITYERNAWGNDTGDTIQPSQVKAAR
jgi:cytochrome c oxidase subunit 2